MCGCRKNVASASGAVGSITGFKYTAPDKTVSSYLTIIEARTAQRRNGGGTIQTIRAK